MVHRDEQGLLKIRNQSEPAVSSIYVIHSDWYSLIPGNLYQNKRFPLLIILFRSYNHRNDTLQNCWWSVCLGPQK